jgi:large subunit ribosomal protein L25
MLSFNHYHVLKALENEGFYSHILTLHINNEKQQAVLKDVQRHPFKPRILHLDFLRINPKEKIVMNVPLHFTGEDKSAALKEGGVFMHLTSSVEVRCLPSALPEYIELKLPEGVELTAFAHGHAEAHDTGVVKMHIPRAVEEEPAAVPAGEVPASSAPAAGKEAGKEKTDSKK